MDSKATGAEAYSSPKDDVPPSYSAASASSTSGEDPPPPQQQTNHPTEHTEHTALLHSTNTAKQDQASRYYYSSEGMAGGDDHENGIALEGTRDDDAIMPSYYGNEDEDELAPPKKVEWWRRHWGKLLALLIFIVVIIIIFAVVVPKIAIHVMEELLINADIEVEEMELIGIRNGTANIRLQAWLSVDAPLDVSGYTEEGMFEMLMADPLDRSTLSSIGTVLMPKIYAEGTTVFINVTTILIIASDRMFHAFLTDALANSTLETYLDGDVTLTAEVPVYKELTATVYWHKLVLINGMNGLEFNLETFDLMDNTTETELYLLFNLTIYNPSQFYASFPLVLYCLDLRVYIEGVYVGQMIPLNLLISKGWSDNQAIGILIKTAENNETIGEFFGDYLMNITVPIDVDGTFKVDLGMPRNPDYPSYLSIVWPMPGCNAYLIEGLFVPSESIEISLIRQTISFEAIGLMKSPLLFPMDIYYIGFDAWVAGSCNDTVDQISETFEDPFFVPAVPDGVCLPLESNIGPDHFNCMVNSINDLILYLKNATIVAGLHSFMVAIPFEYGPLEGVVGDCSAD